MSVYVVCALALWGKDYRTYSNLCSLRVEGEDEKERLQLTDARNLSAQFLAGKKLKRRNGETEDKMLVKVKLGEG